MKGNSKRREREKERQEGINSIYNPVNHRAHTGCTSILVITRNNNNNKSSKSPETLPDRI